MKKEISRNPSFTPSPKLRAHLNSHREGVTERLNNIFDRYAHLVRACALPLDAEETQVLLKEVAIKWSAAPDMTPQTVLYRRPVAQFSNFQPKIVSS
ncbi:hypothetical protein ACLH1H_27375, partial [Klebsiella sp. 1SHAk5cef]